MYIPVQYDSSAIEMSWGFGEYAIDFTEGGLGDDTFLEVVNNEQLNLATYGCDGQPAVSKQANRGAVISVTTKNNSPLSKTIARVASLMLPKGVPLVVAPFKIKDPHGGINLVAANAWLSGKADVTLGKDMGEQTWMWEASIIVPTDDPVAALGSIASFV